MSMRLHSVLLFSFSVVGCHHAPKRPTLPEQPAGCEVELTYGSPNHDTRNLGRVSATCGDEVNEAACLRQLKDEVCKLGGDVVWEVSEKPERVGDKNKFVGRAALRLRQ